MNNKPIRDRRVRSQSVVSIRFKHEIFDSFDIRASASSGNLPWLSNFAT